MTPTGKNKPQPSPEPTPEGATFPKTARLLDKKQFDQVFSHALKVSDRHFLILMHQRDKTPGEKIAAPRLGLIVSKKVDKRAVGRNRIKRQVRESFRQQRQLPGCDFVVIGRPAASRASNAELRQSLDRLWQQASLKFNQRRNSS